MSGWSVIASTNTVSGGAISMTGLSLSSYRMCRLLITSVKVVTNDTSPCLRLSTSASFITGTSYRYGVLNRQPGVGGNAGQGSGEVVMWLSPWQGSYKVGNGSDCAYFADVILGDMTGSGFRRHIFYRAIHNVSSTRFVWSRGSNSVDNTGAIDGIRLLTFDGSGIASGRLTLHGLT